MHDLLYRPGEVFDTDMLLDGRILASAVRDNVTDPATEQVIAAVSCADTDFINMAVDAARRAFPKWSSDEALRRRALRAAATAIRADARWIGRLITLETGKPIAQGLLEAQIAADILDYNASVDIADVSLLKNENQSVHVGRRPLGVVAAIAPWNVPIILLVSKLAPALRAGNTVVAKPSEHSPLSALRLAKVLKDVFPAGVLNIIAGDGAIGRKLIEHPEIAHISFTGSIATGKLVAMTAAASLKRVTLELGGNDPAIVLPDIDLEAVAERLFWGAFYNSGQVCFAIKRLYVHETIAAPLAEILVARCEATRVGSGFDERTELGPISTKPQFEKFTKMMEAARAAGARIRYGGMRKSQAGFFVSPAIVTDAGADLELVREEQFGPALPIIPFRHVDDAIEQANDTIYGLGASVWTTNVQLGCELINLIDAGLGWVNAHGPLFPGSPVSGRKQSGLGVTGGSWGYDQLVGYQVVNVAR